jgi:transcription elongation factor Elf1
MTYTVYGREVTCDDCGSDNIVERTRTEYTDYGGAYEYAVAVCQTCGWEVSL